MRKNRTSQLSKSTIILLLISSGYALPSGENIINGKVLIQRDGKEMVIKNSDGAIIDWSQFNISKDEIVRILQDKDTSYILNRVLDNQVSKIDGILKSNANVFLINTSGILIGKNAKIDTKGFVASALDIKNKDFLDKNFDFKGDGGLINNQGLIIVKDGKLALIGKDIKNSGILKSTKGGDIILAAGERVKIRDLKNQKIEFDIQAPKGSVVNLGEILTNSANLNIRGKSISISGIISSNGGNINIGSQKETTNLKITQNAKLSSSSNDKNAGNIIMWADDARYAGSYEAKSAKQNGALIETSGKNIKIDTNIKVDTKSAKKNGEWLIDPVNINIVEQNTAGATNSLNADQPTNNITNKAITDQLANTNITITTQGANGGDGDINIDADIIANDGNTNDLKFIADRTITIKQNKNIDLKSGAFNIQAKNIALEGSSIKSQKDSRWDIDPKGNFSMSGENSLVFKNLLVRKSKDIFEANNVLTNNIHTIAGDRLVVDGNVEFNFYTSNTNTGNDRVHYKVDELVLENGNFIIERHSYKDKNAKVLENPKSSNIHSSDSGIEFGSINKNQPLKFNLKNNSTATFKSMHTSSSNYKDRNDINMQFNQDIQSIGHGTLNLHAPKTAYKTRGMIVKKSDFTIEATEQTNIDIKTFSDNRTAYESADNKLTLQAKDAQSKVTMDIGNMGSTFKGIELLNLKGDGEISLSVKKGHGNINNFNIKKIVKEGGGDSKISASSIDIGKNLTTTNAVHLGADKWMINADFQDFVQKDENSIDLRAGNLTISTDKGAQSNRNINLAGNFKIAPSSTLAIGTRLKSKQEESIMPSINFHSDIDVLNSGNFAIASATNGLNMQNHSLNIDNQNRQGSALINLRANAKAILNPGSINVASSREPFFINLNSNANEIADLATINLTDTELRLTNDGVYGNVENFPSWFNNLSNSLHKNTKEPLAKDSSYINLTQNIQTNGIGDIYISTSGIRIDKDVTIENKNQDPAANRLSINSKNIQTQGNHLKLKNWELPEINTNSISGNLDGEDIANSININALNKNIDGLENINKNLVVEGDIVSKSSKVVLSSDGDITFKNGELSSKGVDIVSANGAITIGDGANDDTIVKSNSQNEAVNISTNTNNITIKSDATIGLKSPKDERSDINLNSKNDIDVNGKIYAKNANLKAKNSTILTNSTLDTKANTTIESNEISVKADMISGGKTSLRSNSNIFINDGNIVGDGIDISSNSANISVGNGDDKIAKIVSKSSTQNRANSINISAKNGLVNIQTDGIIGHNDAGQNPADVNIISKNMLITGKYDIDTDKGEPSVYGYDVNIESGKIDLILTTKIKAQNIADVVDKTSKTLALNRSVIEDKNSKRFFGENLADKLLVKLGFKTEWRGYEDANDKNNKSKEDETKKIDKGNVKISYNDQGRVQVVYDTNTSLKIK